MTRAPIRTGIVTLGLLAVGLAASSGASSCRRTEAGATPKTGGSDAPGPLVVYCGRGEVLVGKLLAQFTETSGTQLEIRYGETPELAVRLAQEGATGPADVFFAQDAGYLGALAQRGLLAELPEALLEPLDPRFVEGRAFAPTSGRARVLCYDPARLPADQLPRTLADLADERFRGRLGWAPQNGSFQAHVSALRHIWGENETRDWLRRMQALEPRKYPKNGPQVQAVSAGEIAIGWVNHYYLHKLRSGDGSLRAANWSLPVEGDAGNLLMTSGVAVLAGARRPQAARALVEYLLSAEAQGYFAKETFEYPTRRGVATHPDVPAIDSLHLRRVEQAHLTDLEPTLEMLRQLGIL